MVADAAVRAKQPAGTSRQGPLTPPETQKLEMPGMPGMGGLLMAALVALLAPPPGPMDGICDALTDWSAAGMIEPFLWIDAARWTAPRPPAGRVTPPDSS